MTLFDTHAHLLDEQFNDVRNALIPALPDVGVGYVVEACCDEADLPKIAALVHIYDHVYGTAGIHPQSAGTVTPHTLRQIERLLSDQKIVAVGEIGLDYHYENDPRALQRQVFSDQIAIAKAAGKPVVVHDREAHGDCMEILRANRDGLTGVLHCYSGSYEDAVKYVDMGLYIAFGGALTFKNAVRQRDIAARLPLERIVIETDCPYMTPEPHRGTRNDPTLLHLTLEVLAAVRKMTAEETAQITTQNAKRLFGIA